MGQPGRRSSRRKRFDTLNELARDGERLIEPRQRVRCYLRRLTATEHETLSARGVTERQPTCTRTPRTRDSTPRARPGGWRHAAVALWTEDQDHPRDFDDRIQLLDEHDVARIEHNSLSATVRTAANVYQNAADAGLDPKSPAGRLIDLIVARHASQRGGTRHSRG